MMIPTRARFLSLALAAFGAWGLSACSKSDGPVAGATPGKPRVALVMKSLANEFFGTMAEGAKKHAAAHAADFDHISAIKPLLASGAVVATADQHADQLAVFGIEAAREMLQTKTTADRATPVDVVKK